MKKITQQPKDFSKEALLLIKEQILPDTYLRREDGEPIFDKNGHKVLDPHRSPSFIFNKKEHDLAVSCRVTNHLVKQEFAYLAPGSLSALFLDLKGLRRDYIFVEMGESSNIQEIRGLTITQRHQNVRLQVGTLSSIAHGVLFSIGCNKKGEDVLISIGDNTFIGINSFFKGRVSIGNNTSIGFNVTLCDKVTIGNNVIVGDGAILEEGVSIPDNCVVLGRTIVRKEMLSSGNIISLDQYLKEKQKNPQKQRKTGVVQYINKKDLKKLGNMYGFLMGFNEIVTTDNQMFPVLNKLLTTYHPERVKIEPFHGGPTELIHVQYPADIHAFLIHYLREAEKKEKKERYTVQCYKGDFTKTIIDHTSFFKGGTVRLYGDTEIRGGILRENVVLRGDEGGYFRIYNSTIGARTVFHAKGEKKVIRSIIGEENVIHGDIYLEDIVTTKNILLHNVSAIDTKIGERCSIVEANISHAGIGQQVAITGHIDTSTSDEKQQERVTIRYASLGERVHIRYNTHIEGIPYEIDDKEETMLEKQIMIGKDTDISHDVYISQTSSIGENVSIGAGTIITKCGDIGNDVFIGEKSILENIRYISDYAVIPAGFRANSQKQIDSAIRSGVIKIYQ